MLLDSVLHKCRLYFPTLCVAVLMMVGFWVRLYQIDTPLADWHSFRQADTASVTREYVKHGVDLLKPKYHDVSDIQSGKHNLEGLRMVEFPFVNALQAYLYEMTNTMHGLELHVFLRLMSIVVSLIAGFILYIIVSKLESSATGIVSLTAFMLMPFSVYYSRTVLPEMYLVMFGLLGLYAGIRYVDQVKPVWLILSIIGFMLALLLKPIAIFYAIPILILVLIKKPLLWIFRPTHWVALFLVIAPFVWWRWWITQFPEGIPANDWLFNYDNIRFSGAFFYWLFADRLGRIILGYWGLVLVGFGLMNSPSKIPNEQISNYKIRIILRRWWNKIMMIFGKSDLDGMNSGSIVVYSWTLSMTLYLFIFAGGNVRHDYYQLVLMPLICWLVGRGTIALWRLKRLDTIGVMLVSWVFMLAFSWYHVRGYYSINNWAMVRAGEAVDKLAPEDALVIAPYMGDTAFLYQTNRRGWPIGYSIEDKIKKGATHYVTTSFDDEANKLMNEYRIIQKTDEYVVIELVRDNLDN